MLTSNHKTCVVPQKASGERLQNFLKNALGKVYSGKCIKQLIDNYGCKVNGKVEVFSSYKVSSGDRVQVDIQKLDSKKVVSNKQASISLKKVKILYEDAECLICDKPVNTISDEKVFKELLQRDSLYMVHRLDKDTTGVILLAKNESMQKLLEDLFRKREVEKVYHAIVEGKSSKALFKVENSLGKLSQYEGQSIWGFVPKGLYALTHFEVLKRAKNHLLLKCVPFTGRTHQIRVHLAEEKLPILGDSQYCRDKAFTYSALRPLLHAYSLSFIHPKDERSIHVTAPYPSDFKQALSEIFEDA